LYIRERIPVVKSCIIQAAVIPTGPPGTVRFRDHMERGSPGGVRAADNAGGLHLRKLLLRGGKLGGVETAGLCKQGPASGLNGVPDVMRRRLSRQVLRQHLRKTGEQLVDIRI